MSDTTPEPNVTNTFTQDNGPIMLGEPFWSANPIEVGEETTLTVRIEYEGGKVVAGEYIDNVDPGQGSGKPMEVKGDHLTMTMTTDLTVGSHPINIRAKDANGQWSALEPTVLTVMGTPIVIPVTPEPPTTTTP